MKWWKTKIYRDMTRRHDIHSRKFNLPKQWKHWIYISGLTKQGCGYFRTHFGNLYFSGKGRHFVSTDLMSFSALFQSNTLTDGLIPQGIHIQ